MPPIQKEKYIQFKNTSYLRSSQNAKQKSSQIHLPEIKQEINLKNILTHYPLKPPRSSIEKQFKSKFLNRRQLMQNRIHIQPKTEMKGIIPLQLTYNKKVKKETTSQHRVNTYSMGLQSQQNSRLSSGVTNIINKVDSQGPVPSYREINVLINNPNSTTNTKYQGYKKQQQKSVNNNKREINSVERQI